ncbi:MAG: hypothetical protein WA632_15605 [Gallionella sp.]
MPYTSKLSSLSIGNKIIDAEHRALNGIVDDLTQMIMFNHDVAVKVSFNLLYDRLRDYSAKEAELARAVNFAFATHHQAHQHLLQQIRMIQDRLENQKGFRSQLERKNCIEALKACLLQHISVESKEIKKVLDTYPYDFNPVSSRPV